MVEQGFYSLFIHQKEELRNEKNNNNNNNNNNDCKRAYDGTPLIQPPVGHGNLSVLMGVKHITPLYFTLALFDSTD